MYPSNLFIKHMNSFENGSLGLLHGEYSLEIETRFKPKSVWTSESDCGSMQVCQGGGNLFGVTILETGFILHAVVKTDFTTVKYEILY